MCKGNKEADRGKWKETFVIKAGKWYTEKLSSIPASTTVSLRNTEQATSPIILASGHKLFMLPVSNLNIWGLICRSAKHSYFWSQGGL